MNQCKECQKGYCPSRVRRVFGFVQSGYCSPQCFTASVMGKAKPSPLKVAEEIIDTLYVGGYISDDVASSPDKFAEAVKLISPHLKGMKL